MCVPGACVPGVCVPGVCVPGVCIPGACIPGVCVPGVCVPGAVFYLLKERATSFETFINRSNDINHHCIKYLETGPRGAVAMPSANGMVGTGFASRCRHQFRAGL